MKHALAILVVSVPALFATGCSKTDDPPLPRIGQESTVPHGSLSTPVLPDKPLPSPLVPKESDALSRPTMTAPIAGSMEHQKDNAKQ